MDTLSRLAEYEAYYTVSLLVLSQKNHWICCSLPKIVVLEPTMPYKPFKFTVHLKVYPPQNCDQCGGWAWDVDSGLSGLLLKPEVDRPRDSRHRDWKLDLKLDHRDFRDSAADLMSALGSRCIPCAAVSLCPAWDICTGNIIAWGLHAKLCLNPLPTPEISVKQLWNT